MSEFVPVYKMQQQRLNQLLWSTDSTFTHILSVHVCKINIELPVPGHLVSI